MLRDIAGEIAFALRGIETEKERRRSEEIMRATFRSARDGILMADAETQRFVTANEAMCRMLGYSAEEILDLSVTDIYPAEDRPRAMAAFERQLRGEISLAANIAVMRKDGSFFPADINAAPLELNGRPHLLGILRDITERKLAEAEKDELQKQLLHAQKMESIGNAGGRGGPRFQQSASGHQRLHPTADDGENLE